MGNVYADVANMSVKASLIILGKFVVSTATI
jgi:hypothetical protein